MNTAQDILFLQNRVAYIRDETAYRELFLHFYPSLYRLAFHIAAKEELAEEIVSDVMLKIWTMENRLGHISNLRTYLFTATKNTAFTYLKKNSRETTLMASLLHQEAAPAPTPHDQLVSNELSSLIEKTVASLPQQCQLVFRLVKEEGFSYREVSAILGVSQNTLESQMRIALKRIRQALDGYLEKK